MEICWLLLWGAAVEKKGKRLSDILKLEEEERRMGNRWRRSGQTQSSFIDKDAIRRFFIEINVLIYVCHVSNKLFLPFIPPFLTFTICQQTRSGLLKKTGAFFK